MRCPKCQYLGFEPSPRCKNCGYDFSFDNQDLPPLTIVPEPDASNAFTDFDLQEPGEVSRPSKSAGAGFDLDDLLANGRSAGEPAATRSPAPEPASVRGTAAARVTPPAAAPAAARKVAARAPVAPPVPAAPPAPVTTELPLFMQVMSDAVLEESASGVAAGMPLTIEAATESEEEFMPAAEEIDDRPLVQVPTVLRPPLAVRRPTPDPQKMRAKYARATTKVDAEGAGDLLRGIDDLDASLGVAPEHGRIRLSAEPTPESLPAGWLEGVSAGKRLAAAIVDGALLASIDVAVVWFTLAVCGMAPSQAHLLPLIPLGLFFVLVAGAYLVLFTAACGQTIGKMLAGIRVVGTDASALINDRITVGQAVARAAGAIASSIPLGAGFWMTLVGDGRALHDRIAHTRVVRA
jgi:uncharacterized RDD family membrane protein YckC